MWWLVWVAIAIIGFFIIRGLMTNSRNNSGFYKPVHAVDLLTGEVTDIDVDYMNPENEIKWDPQTSKPYLTRQFGFMKTGDKRYWLGKYFRKDFSGWKLYINNVGELDTFYLDRLMKLETSDIKKDNLIAEKEARIVELETKISEVLGARVEFAEKQNIASRKGIPQKMHGSSGGGYK